MSWGVVHGAMLLGLLGAAIPVLVHLLNRRWDPVIDWGAMQFLELGRRTRRRSLPADWLLMLARMALLALVALAMARPYWTPREAVAEGAGADEAGPGGPERRDLVLILDGSASMDRRAKGTTPRAEAIAWARRLVVRLRPGCSVAVLVAKDRVRPLVDPPSFDRARVDAALAGAPAARGSSDLPAALAEAFRVLERAENPARDVIVLTDAQRSPWRPGEAARWALLRDLHRRLPVPPRLWSIAFGAPADAPNGSVGPLELSRGLVAPGAPISVTTTIANAGPGPLTRTAELLVDGALVPGSAQVVGPIPAGGRAPARFRAAIEAPGSHVLAVRLAAGDDSLPGDDLAERPVEVAAALPVLLVDGEPGREPLTGEVDFLRAALAPADDEAPQVRASVIRAEALGPEPLNGRRVAVLANVDRLAPAQAAAVEAFLASGGGVLVAPGDRTDAGFANDRLYRGGEGWLPARLGELKGAFGRREAVAHPAPGSFEGPALAPFGRGDDPPLGRAGLFAYRRLTASPRSPAASVSARLDTGDPWIVERPFRRGRVILLAGPVDAEGGTLPVNPDFVPWVHELAFRLADAGAGARAIRPGEPIVLDLDPPPPARVDGLAVRTPGGATARAAVTRSAGSARARFDDTSEPGLYRFALPDPPGGSAHVAVVGDDRESDPETLDQAEAARLAEGWPLAFESSPDRLAARILAPGRAGRREAWRALILAALACLCLEVYLTRRLARGGPPPEEPSHDRR